MDDPYAPARDALAGDGLAGDAADGDAPGFDGADPAVLAARLDEADPLSSFADRYHVPGDRLYMDGNSLGPASDAALASVDRVVDEWREL
ncbi:kynureninase, partial [Halorubrum sp. Ea1]